MKQVGRIAGRSSCEWDVGRGARAIQLGGGGGAKAQYRPKAGKKKKTHKVVFFFSGSHFVSVMLHHKVG